MLLNKTHNGCVGWAWLAGGRGLNATAISPIKITRLGFIQEAHKANSLQERTENAVPRRELSTAILPAKRTPCCPVSRPRFWPLLKGTHLSTSLLHTSKPCLKQGTLSEPGLQVCKMQLKIETKDPKISLYLPPFLPVFCPLPPPVSAHCPRFSKPATTVCIYTTQIYYSCKARAPIN